MSIFAAAAMIVYGIDEPIYLVDSFEGLPLPRVHSDRLHATPYGAKSCAEATASGYPMRWLSEGL